MKKPPPSGLTPPDNLALTNQISFVVCSVIFFGVLNASGVAVILPEIRDAFAINAGQVNWVISGYLLTYGIAIPFYGKLADRFGARPLFLFGVVLFSMGSVACFFASSFDALMLARVAQALGGAAFPGLGVMIASRAVPPENRGKLLGLVSATVGVGAAVGPLLSGLLTNLFSWQAFFGASALVALVLPFAAMVLPRDLGNSQSTLDLIGGAFLALGITGLLFAVSQSSQTSWEDPIILVALVVSMFGFVALVIRQRRLVAPFIPADLIGNARYLQLVSLAFVAAGVNLASIIAFPLMLSTHNQLDTLHIGLVLMPAAVATAVCGIWAGKQVDAIGPRRPALLGGSMMLFAIIALSSLAGGSTLTIALLAMLLAGGFAFLNTPIAIVVSILVPPSTLASALSINTMMFFVGGSLGAALFSSIVTTQADALSAWNVIYAGSATNYSDAFAVLAIGVVLSLALVVQLPARKMVTADQDQSKNDEQWASDCSIPWCPDLIEEELSPLSRSSSQWISSVQSGKKQ